MGCELSNVAPYMTYSTKCYESINGQTAEFRRNVKNADGLL